MKVPRWRRRSVCMISLNRNGKEITKKQASLNKLIVGLKPSFSDPHALPPIHEYRAPTHDTCTCTVMLYYQTRPDLYMQELLQPMGSIATVLLPVVIPQ